MPPTLQNVSVHMLDVGLMQAGASVKGEFEKRLKAVIDEVQSSEKPIILFIDEAHTLIGAGGAAGTGDAANLLKPALARGELRTIAATTWAEYKQHIEKDPALTRRFQVVKIDEPSEAVAVLMLRGVAGVLEQHHKVQILDEAIEAAVGLSHRYIPARQLPDKAVSLLDTACARVAISQHATPAEVEDILRRRQALEVENGIIGREAAIGIEVTERQARVDAGLAETEGTLAAAQARWEREKALVAEILELRARLRGEGVPLDAVAAAEEAAGETAAADAAAVSEAKAPGTKPDEAEASKAKASDTETAEAEPETTATAGSPAPDPAADLARLRELMAELAEAQGETPLILPSVDRNAVAAVVQDWTGIPTGRMLSSQTEKALRLAGTLSERVVGQDHAMEMIAKRVQTSRAGLGAPEKPVGVFLLCGPSGVGKTETALALAETLYGGEQNLISINMSEFQEAHTVSTLKGAPPGYVGYGKGGILTEAVRRKPYSVILLDEVEKAHPDVHEIFFQVFDKGMMDDSEGRRIDFKNTLILLTSNVGSEVIMDRTRNGTVRTGLDDLDTALRSPLLKVFPAAFLGRVVTIPYYPLSDAMIEAITRHQFAKIARRLRASQRCRTGDRRRRHGPGQGALHRDRIRRADDRCHPDQHAAAGTEPRRAEPLARGREDDESDGWRFSGRVYLLFRVGISSGISSCRRKWVWLPLEPRSVRMDFRSRKGRYLKPVAQARGDDRDPEFSGERPVEYRADDDVGISVDLLADAGGGFVDFEQRHVHAA